MDEDEEEMDVQDIENTGVRGEGSEGYGTISISWRSDQQGILHFTSLHFTPLHYTILHYTTLHYTTPHYTAPHHTAPHHTELHCIDRT